MKKQVGVYQSKDEYPSLHIIVTDNPAMLKGRKILGKGDVALQVEVWLSSTGADEETDTDCFNCGKKESEHARGKCPRHTEQKELF